MHGMSRWVLGLALTAVIAFPAGAARTDWREMSVANFHIFSTLQDGSTRGTARQLQAFQDTVGRFLVGRDPLPDVPTNIYILDKRDFQKYAAWQGGLAGFFQQSRFQNIIVIDGSLDFAQVRETIFHEYTHFLQANSSSRHYPPWYVEGYACLFSSFLLRDQTVYLGEAPGSLSITAEGWIPIERILAVKRNDPEFMKESLTAQFYGESWALVHMLLFDDKAYLGPVSQYLGQLDSGLTEPEAFQTSFPFSKADLDAALKKLLRRQVIHVKRLEVQRAIVIDEAPIRPLSRPDADARMARLVFDLGRPESVVSGLLDEAIRSAGKDPRIRAQQARYLSANGKPVAVDDLVSAERQETRPDDQMRIDLAATLSDDSAVRRALAKAAELLNSVVDRPNPPLEAVAIWSDARVETGTDLARTTAVLNEALVRAPRNTALLGILARAQESTGDRAGAKATYNRIIEASNDPQDRLWAQKQADSERLSQPARTGVTSN